MQDSSTKSLQLLTEFAVRQSPSLSANSIAADAEPLRKILTSELAVDFVRDLRRDPSALEKVVDRDRSRDVGSHIKWFLAEEDGFSLWVNEYRTSSGPGRASTIHNHRYGFASVVVFGEFTQRKFTATSEGEDLVSIAVIEQASLQAGDSYSLNADEIHQISAWGLGTATLVLKAPAIRKASNVYDPTSFRVSQVSAMSAITPFGDLQKLLSE